MYLKSIELSGFKSFAKKDKLDFTSAISGIVGPNGSGKSNVAESFRFVLGEQSMKQMRGKRGEDMIFNGSPSAPRQNRASVSVVFDNTDKFLDIDYDEVSIERTVLRDGSNQYSINNSQVRLKDVHELLASANIGASGHHIISQGEADRILNASSKEKREIIEEALGLKVFQYKKQESERKLAKTEDNIAQVESLRKEIAPHLRFLERQVKKIEKALSMRDELKQLYGEYLKREHIYIEHHKADSAQQRQPLMREKDTLQSQLDEAKAKLEASETQDARSQEIIALEQDIASARAKKDTLSRDLGRVEGQISFEERRVAREKEKQSPEDKLIKLSDVEALSYELSEGAEKITDVASLLSFVKQKFQEFISHKREEGLESGISEEELEGLKEEKIQLENQLASATEADAQLNKKYEELRKEIESSKDESREAEKEVFRIMQEQNALDSKIGRISAVEERVTRDEEELQRELTEAGVLVGPEVTRFESVELSVSREEIIAEEREKQENRRREIEKIKIRLEEAGGGSADEIMSEYKEVSERDQFFEKELADLHASSDSLKGLIAELDQKLDEKFKEGIKKINTAFQEFFELLFDGGNASLALVKEEKKKKPTGLEGEVDEEGMVEEPEPEEVEAGSEGIEVKLNLPRKKVRGLDMLSGGERALTSIALLFAMSQVNPPPFIILDETDAALDEANSRKYGDMIENLSKRSQLILITHNRETMSRAGILYGITMGGDGISKVLSVKLEEAVMVAK